ncbi:MAG TPA: hypothetical protein VGD69_03160 [Herpetosiphonaceae bacterium]
MSPHTHNLKRGLIAALLGTVLTACGTPDDVFQSAGSIPPTREPAVTQTAQPTPLPALATTTPVSGSAQPTATPQPAAQPIIGFSPQSGQPGTMVSIFGSGYPADQPVKVRLGLPQPMGEVLVSAVPGQDGRWSTTLTMPASLPSGDTIPSGTLYLVAMDDQNVALASAPFAFSAPALEPTPVIRDGQPQPANDPLQAVELFMTALQHDRTGKTASFYTGGTLRTTFEDGITDIGGVLHEHNPFQWFTVDRVVGSDQQNTYVKGALHYGPGAAYDRIFTVSNREDGEWRVFKVTVPDPEPTAGPSHPAAIETVQALLGGYTNQADLKPYLATNIRREMEAGRPLHAILGLHPIALQSFAVDAPEDRPSEVLFVPATLVYESFSEERLFTLVVEDGTWRINGSQPR